MKDTEKSEDKKIEKKIQKKIKKLLDKKMCKAAKKEILSEYPQAYASLMKNAEYICKKCGRAAAEKKNLCKPYKNPYA